MAKAANTEADFWAKVAIGAPDQCWPWTRARSIDGYGQATWQNRQVKAHRLAYEFHHNMKLPQWVNGASGVVVMHTCDNPPCCNPAHLRLGTVLANRGECVEKRRHRVPLGEDNGIAKLTNRQVRQIKAMLAKGALGIDLARHYGVDKTIISKINTGKIWRHV